MKEHKNLEQAMKNIKTSMSISKVEEFQPYDDKDFMCEIAELAERASVTLEESNIVDSYARFFDGTGTHENGKKNEKSPLIENSDNSVSICGKCTIL